MEELANIGCWQDGWVIQCISMSDAPTSTGALFLSLLLQRLG